MKKCLFITTQFPYPLNNGGKIGAFNGLNVVSGDFETNVLSFSEEPEEINEGIEYFSKKLPNVFFEKPIIHPIHIRKKPFSLFKVMLGSYLRNRPYVAEKFENRKMYKLIDSYIKEQYWDIIFIDYLNMANYFKYIMKKYKKSYGKIIFKNHNVEHEIIYQAAKNSKGIKKVILDIEWRRTKRFETFFVKNADFVFTVCNEDTSCFNMINKNTYSMLPTLENKSIVRKNITENKILYVGNLSWGANLKGIIWFVNNVLPRINKTIGDAKLTIVGSGIDYNPFCENNNVEYLGYVKNVDELYCHHKVFVVPLFEGSGIRIKILEAFNNEIPVVSTCLGCYTIGAESGRDIFVADNEIDFANHVIDLLINDKLRNEMTKNAKEFLDINFSLEKRREEFCKYLNIK